MALVDPAASVSGIRGGSIMFHYYEVLVCRRGQDQVVARVPTRQDADRAVVELLGTDAVSERSVRWERRRGLHPWNGALLCGALLLVSMFVPLAGLRLGLTLLLAALTSGFLTSGRRWIAGGKDDR
jgi:hypothetical protein